MKMPGNVVPGTWKACVGFQTMPVGAAKVPGSAPSGGGTVTTEMMLPSPPYSEETPAWLSLTQKGLPGAKAIPQAFCELGSVNVARPLTLESRFVTVKLMPSAPGSARTTPAAPKFNTSSTAKPLAGASTLDRRVIEPPEGLAESFG